MPTMPNIVGLELSAADGVLQKSGVLVPTSIGYFGSWPITVQWNGTKSLNAGPGVITSQSPAQGLNVTPNVGMQLSVVPFPMGVSYPASGPGTAGGFIFGVSQFGVGAF